MIRPFGLMVHNGEPLFIFADVPRDPMCEKSQLTQARNQHRIASGHPRESAIQARHMKFLSPIIGGMRWGRSGNAAGVRLQAGHDLLTITQL
jgi:hypothetical protein